MRIERFRAQGFRNLTHTELKPGPGINFLTGLNGQGKTSFLEAIGYLSFLRSFRDAKTQEVIQSNHSQAVIGVDIVSDDPAHEEWKTSLQVEFFLEPARKQAWINGKGFRSSIEYVSQRFGSYRAGFHAVVFNPSDHELIRGEPSGRRKFLDQVLAAESQEYLGSLSRYRRILEQRNQTLKNPGWTGKVGLLESYTEPLAKEAAQITRARWEWLQKLDLTLGVIHSKMAFSIPFLSCFFASKWHPIQGDSFTGHADLPSLETIEQVFLEQLRATQFDEARLQTTLVGPHRDDWGLNLGERPLKGFGSQGEVRTALLALKLSEITLYRQRTGQRPIFLLDDFSSELDHSRRERLLGFLLETDLQVFVTSTETIQAPGEFFRVEQGQVIGVLDSDEHPAEHTSQIRYV